MLDSLIEAFERTAAPIVIPTTNGRRGSPVLMARPLFPELAAIEGDIGGRQLFGRYDAQIVEVPVADPLTLRDIDTWSDYEELHEIAERS